MTQPENMTRSDIEARQLERLNVLLAEVTKSNAFWQARLADTDISTDSFAGLNSLSDLAALPLTRKSDLVADQAKHPPYGSNLTYEFTGYSRLHQTSGTTTGQPMRWLLKQS